MAGGRSEEEGGCRVRFRIEWAMWGNLNALYAAASKERRGEGERERQTDRQTERQRQRRGEKGRERRGIECAWCVCVCVVCVLGDIFCVCERMCLFCVSL